MTPNILFTAGEKAFFKKLAKLDADHDIELTPEEAELFGVTQADKLPPEDLSTSKPVSH